MNAPQSLPAPQRAADARWAARLSKTQRAVLRLLASGDQSPLSLAAIEAGLRIALAGRGIHRPVPATDRALTRLIGLGFVDYRLAPHRSQDGEIAYYITVDGRKRAAMTRPKL